MKPMTTKEVLEQKLHSLEETDLKTVLTFIETLLEQKNQTQPAKYDFSSVAGSLTWQGDAVATQRALRDEWE